MREAIILHVAHVGPTRYVTVERWPLEMAFDPYLLEAADPDLLVVDGDEVTITVTNGRAVYRLERSEVEDGSPGIPAHLVESRLSEPSR